MSRSSFASQMRRVAREQARSQREHERAVARQQKEEARAYSDSRLELAADETTFIKEREELISSLLVRSIGRHNLFDFEAAKKAVDNTNFESTVCAPEQPRWESFTQQEPKGLARFIPGSRRRFFKKELLAQNKYDQAILLYQEAMEQRQAAKDQFYSHQSESNAACLAHNRAIDELKKGLSVGEHQAIVNFFSDTLSAEFGEEFDAVSVEVGFSQSSNHLVLDLELPSLDVIPEEIGFRYVKSADRIDAVIRPAVKRKSLYANLIAQICLKCLSHASSLLQTSAINNITLNGMLDGVDPATGHDVRVCLISVSVNPEAIQSLKLSQVQPEQCLKTLKASVSRAPAEMAPVKPLVELDMVDPRFIASSDVMSSLDKRTNLMDLSPNQFEGLVTNLFMAMGLDTRQTRASRDGGVDCVAFDQRPIFGGKVVIQAKRYKGTVGVSAVRDLFGTVQNEGASKGILVTTSGYGKASYDFAKGKPLELLDGGNLLHLLLEHAEIDAKIVMPDDWKDSYTHAE